VGGRPRRPPAYARDVTPVLQQIWRYPAKSMLGEQLDRSELVATGLVGDRGWALRDEVRGGIRGAKKLGGLMRLGARYLTEPEAGAPPPAVELHLPDGTVTTSERADVDEQLSRALGHPVTLWPVQPADALDHYRRGAPDHEDLDTELRDLFGRLPEEPLPDLSVFPPEIIEFESPPGTYVDAFPVHLLTTASMRRLATLVDDEATVDVRRFRPNLVVDVDVDEDHPWPEQAWVGRPLRVGTVELEVVAPCPRCVMVTRPVAALDGDRTVLRAVVAAADQNLGVYATVTTPGTVSVGDHVVIG